MARSDWYVRVGGVERGPLSGTELRQLAARGEIAPGDEVRRAADGPWVPASAVRGLFPVRKTPYDVFVSHSTTDKVEVDGIIHSLEARGVRCWVAPRDVIPGTNWGEAIIRGMESCRILLLVLSEDSNASPQIVLEVERAVAKGLIVVPFRIDNVDVSKQLEYYVSAVHWLDAFSQPLETHVTELAGVLKRILSADSEPPDRTVAPPRPAPPRRRRQARSRVRWIPVAVGLVAVTMATLLFLKPPWNSAAHEDGGEGTAFSEPDGTVASSATRAPDLVEALPPDRVEAVNLGKAWLEAHQSSDGSWDCDGFMWNCGKIGSDECDGPGSATHDVGVTGLALRVLLRTAASSKGEALPPSVTSALDWLGKAQDPDTGLFGEQDSHDFIYDHAIATLALCEAYERSETPAMKKRLQKAVDVIVRARNPYNAWRYTIPPIGDNDMSVTGWMVSALVAAQAVGIQVDYESAFEGALSFLDEVSDPASGRVGYSAFGELSSRTPFNEHYPREYGEAMTAVGLQVRVLIGQTPEDTPIMDKHAALLSRKTPVWDPEGLSNDLYYWCHGTSALHSLKGTSQKAETRWTQWNSALGAALLDAQRQSEDHLGSWDPIGPWGFSGGRVATTAMALLALTEPVAGTQAR